MSGNTSWMDALPTAAPTSAMQMLAAMKMGAGSGAQPVPSPAPSASPLPTPPGADPVPQQMATLTVRPKPGQVVGAPASSPDTSWMDALPTAQPTSAMMLAAAPKGPPSDPGVVANVAAGANGEFANMVGAPVDLATGALNLIPRGINAVAGTHIPLIQNPVMGSQYVGSALGPAPASVAAPTELDRLARAGGAGAVSMLVPWGAAGAVGNLADRGAAAAEAAFGPRGVATAGNMPAALQEMGGAGTAPTMATAGFTGGVAGQEAQDSAPAPLKPLANMLGNVVGGGIPLAARAAIDAALPAAAHEVTEYLQPLTHAGRRLAAGQQIAGVATDLGAVRGTLADAAGANAEAAPLEATVADPNADPAAKAAAQQRLAELGPQRGQIVPGSNQTTYQLTGDQGLGNLERASAKEAPDRFIQRAAEQNEARVGQIDAQAPASAAPQDAVTSFQRQLATLDAQHAAGATADQQAVRNAVTPLGGEPPVGPGAQATALQQYGAGLRGTLKGAAGDVKTEERGLWSRVDPDGSLRVGMAPIREAARSIAKEVPANAAPMTGEEAAIFGKARMLPAVQPFAELGALRSRITDAMRAELVQNGSSQSYRRMTQLLGAVDGAMSDGVQAQAERDAAGVADGTVAPGDTINARMAQYNQGPSANDNGAAAAQPTLSLGPRAPVPGDDTAATLGGAPGDRGGESQGGAGYGSAGSDSGVAPGAAVDVAGTEAPNFDADAQARYQRARAATAQYHQTYTDQRTAPGVAPVLAPGSRAGEFRAPESAVPGLLFAPGKGAAERVGAFLKAGGTPAQVKDYLAFSLRSAAEKEDGTLKPAPLERWLGQNREALDAAGLSPQFDTVAKAQAALDGATARRVAERDAFQKSAAGQFLGDGDPVARVGRILRSDTAEATMRDLARRTAGDPAARAGLQKAVVEHILGELRSNAEAGDTGVRQLKADAFQTFVRKATPALRQIFKPDQVKAIEDVATDIQRTQRSVIGTKLPGGSNTAQDLAAGAKHGGHKPSLVGSLVAMEAAGEMAGHLGGPMGKVIGMVGVPFLNAMRHAGIQRINDLVADAMLHPELAHALLAKVPAGGFTKSVVDNAVRQIRALGANAAMRGPMQFPTQKGAKR